MFTSTELNKSALTDATVQVCYIITVCGITNIMILGIQYYA
jgi:hypothetical protein